MNRQNANPCLLIIGALFMLLSGTIARAQTPDTATLRATLTTARSNFFIGEDIAVNYCVENASQMRFDADPTRFRPVVTNTRGAVMPQPTMSVMLYSLPGGGVMQHVPVEPGGRWCRSFPLMKFVRIDRAGDYNVRATIELVAGGMPAIHASLRGGTPPTVRDGPEAQTTLTLTMPTAAQAESVLAALEALPLPYLSTRAEHNPYDGVAMFPTIYLAPLRKRADAGDIHALAAIAGMPYPEAARALIDLTGHHDSSIARGATHRLPSRLPPALAGVLGIPEHGGALGTLGGFGTDPDMTESWRTDFAVDVRTLAKELLTSTDQQDIRAGAFMIAAVGEDEDATDVAAALTRAIAQVPAVPLASDIRQMPRGVAQELLRAARALVGRGYTPTVSGATSGEVAQWLVALGVGRRPNGWEAALAQALKHESSYTRGVALNHMLLPVPAALVADVAASVGSPDRGLQVDACRLASRAKLRELAGQIREALRTTSDFWVFNECGNALYGLAPRTELFDIAAARLSEPRGSGGQRPDFIGVLFGLFEGTSGYGSDDNVPADWAALSARWQRFIAVHRAQILAGKRWSLDDPAVTADLVPPGTSFRRPGKPNWPRR